jgi:hypothetical protein
MRVTHRGRRRPTGSVRLGDRRLGRCRFWPVQPSLWRSRVKLLIALSVAIGVPRSRSHRGVAATARPKRPARAILTAITPRTRPCRLPRQHPFRPCRSGVLRRGAVRAGRRRCRRPRPARHRQPLVAQPPHRLRGRRARPGCPYTGCRPDPAAPSRCRSAVPRPTSATPAGTTQGSAVLDFSSTQSTTAASGGFRHSPTTSRTLSMNCGSVDSFQVSTRCGWFWARPAAAHRSSPPAGGRRTGPATCRPWPDAPQPSAGLDVRQALGAGQHDPAA